MPTQTRAQQVMAVFTNKIDKISVKVVIHTLNTVIIGEVHVRQRLRLIDELISGDEFLAVTNAEVCDRSNDSRVLTKFLIINREHIVMLLPCDEIEAQNG